MGLLCSDGGLDAVLLAMFVIIIISLLLSGIGEGRVGWLGFGSGLGLRVAFPLMLGVGVSVGGCRCRCRRKPLFSLKMEEGKKGRGQEGRRAGIGVCVEPSLYPVC